MRFQKGVAEALVMARIRHQVGMRVNIRQRVDLLALRVQAARLAHAIGDEAHVDPRVGDAIVQHAQISASLVPSRMRDHEFGARIPEAADQLDGVFDPLALHDARGLEDEPVVFAQADVPAEVHGCNRRCPEAGSRNPARSG